jgi:hypothetical protein
MVKVRLSIWKLERVCQFYGRGHGGAVPMWSGYAFEGIYIVLGIVLIATVLGILIYH